MQQGTILEWHLSIENNVLTPLYSVGASSSAFDK